MAEGYSAGTVFLQVVPVFGGMMREIREEVDKLDRSLGEELEKSGKKAGKKAGKGFTEEMTDAAEKAGEESADKYGGAFQQRLRSSLTKIRKELNSEAFKIDMGADEAQADLERVEKKLKDLRKFKWGKNFDLDKVVRQADSLEAAMLRLRKHANIEMDSNIGTIMAEVEALRKHIAKATAARNEFRLGINSREVQRELGAFERALRTSAQKASRALDSEVGGALGRVRGELKRLETADVLDLTKARSDLAALSAELRALAKDKNATVEVRADAAAAYGQLLAFNKVANRLDGRHLDVSVDLDSGAATTKLAALTAASNGTRTSLFGLGSQGQDTANAFRSFNIVVLAAVSLLPGLIPIIGGVGGALVALIPILGAATGGLIAMIVGFSGIGDAVKALGDVQENAAVDAQRSADAIRAAAQSVEDAERSLARAREGAARANADAARAVGRAQEQAAKQIEAALRRQQKAEQALAKAQRDAREAQQDLIEARREARLELEDLNDKIKQNQLDEAQGVLDVFDATISYDAVMADGSSTNYDKEQARIALEQAKLDLKEIRDEEKALAEEKKKADEEGVNGTETVQNAEDALTAALERQKDAQMDLRDAAQAVRDARIDGARAVADAVRAQQRTEQDGARSVADAQRNLARAQERLKEAYEGTGAAASSAQTKLEQAMSKLGPEGRKFARFLHGLRDEFRAVRDAIQASMLPPIQTAMTQIMQKYGPQLAMWAVGMGQSIGGLFATLGDTMVNSPIWQRFFNMIAMVGPRMFTQFGETMINFMTGFVGIINVATPYAERMGAALLTISENFAAWMASEEGQKEWREFLDYAFTVGPHVIDFLNSMIDGFVNLGKALSPWGVLVLDVLGGIFDWIANMDPKLLGAIAGAALAIFIAFQLAAGIVATLAGLMSALHTPLSRFVLIAFSGIGVIAALYVQFDSVRAIIDPLLGLFGKLFGIVRPLFDFVAKHAETFAVLATVIYGVVLAMKAWRAITALVVLVQAAFTGVAYGAAGATAFQAAVIKVAYVAGRIWNGVMAITKLYQQGLLLFAIRYNAVLLLQTIRTKALAAATKVWAFITGVATKALKVMAFTMRIVRGAMLLMGKAAKLMFGPWGFVILGVVALFVVLYKKFEWFRKGVQAIVKPIVAAFKWIYDGAFWLLDMLFLHSVFPDILDGFKWFAKQTMKVFGWIKDVAIPALVKAFEWVWDRVSPLFPLLVAAAKVLWFGIKLYFKLLIAYWTFVFKAAVFVVKNILLPIFKVIFATMKFLWEKAIKPYLSFVIDFWTFVFKAMKAVWETFLWPVLDLIFTLIGKLWTHVVKPYLGLVAAYWRLVFAGMKAVWNKVLRPVFSALFAIFRFLWTKTVRPVLGWIVDKWRTVFTAMKAVWDKVLSPVFSALIDTALPKLKSTFETVAEGIGKVWRGLKRIVGKPIEFVINTVIRDGLVAGFNKVAKFVGSDGIEFAGVDTSDWYASGGIYGRRGAKYAGGGVLPGYTPGQDVHHFTSPTGGRLHLSGGEAIMRPEVTAALGAGWVDSVNGAARAGGVSAVRRMFEGGRYAKGGVFWPVPGGVVYRSKYNLGHDGMDINHPNDYGDGEGGVVPFYSATSGKVNYVGEGRGYGLATFIQSPYGELVYGHAFPGSVGVKAGQEVFAGQRLALIGNTGRSSGPHLHFGFPGGTFYRAEALLSGAAQIDPKAIKKAGGAGIPGFILDFAKNPVGYLKGLITKPIKRLKERWDSGSDMIRDIAAGPIELAKDAATWAYNKLPKYVRAAVKGGKTVIDKGTDVVKGGLGLVGIGDGGEGGASEGAYRSGGILPYNGTMMYDNGGYLPPGLTTVMNLTGKPEPVFTADQFEKIGVGGRGAGIHYEPHFEGSDLTAADVAHDLDFQFRKIQRGGKYQG